MQCPVCVAIAWLINETAECTGSSIIVHHDQRLLEPVTKPAKPDITSAAPPTNIHIERSVGAPVNMREISDVNEFSSLNPKIVNAIPPTRSANETVLFMARFG
jgi:hypothetical protein